MSRFALFHPPAIWALCCTGTEAPPPLSKQATNLTTLYDQKIQKGNANRATLAVARKLAAYLMPVARGQLNFQIAETSGNIAA
ncbi:MAG: hypothetical protein H0X25_21735 [Acidobacteriales bacterium]|nr:hypothetical protein [Terriglobales bacterium]